MPFMADTYNDLSRDQLIHLLRKRGEWMTVAFDEKKGQNTLDRIFREDLLLTF
jgi:hypothetical protein